MKSYKSLIIIVVLLIAVNCVFIGTLWYTGYHRRQPVMMRGHADVYLTKVLKLSAQQINQYDTLRNRHHEFTQKLQEEQRLQRDSFFDNLKNPASTTKEISGLEKRILANQGKLDSATFYHFKNFRAILNAGQQTRFDEIIKDVLHTMGHAPGGPQGQPGPAIGNGSPQGLLNGPPQDNGHGHGPPGGRPNDGKRHQGPPPNGFPPNGPPPDWPMPNGPPPGK